MKSRTSLGVCTIHADPSGYRERTANRARAQAAAAVLDWAAETKLDLVVFPAGYLRARTARPDDVAAEAAAIVDHAREHRIAIVVGVDACAPEFRAPDDTLAARSRLPHFAVAWSPESNALHVWQQRSTTASDARAVSEERAIEVRALPVRGRVVGVALSGEGFNPVVRERLAAAKPALAVMPAHVAGGLRHWQALGWLRDHGVPVVRAVHAHAGAENVLWRGKGKERPLAIETFVAEDVALEAARFAA